MKKKQSIQKMKWKNYKYRMEGVVLCQQLFCKFLGYNSK